ncbi:MAG: hypothetical protein IH851_13025 [Armatimonadetes bacterium]|nr:hypothetical protein [Armatimonadota bacterium]
MAVLAQVEGASGLEMVFWAFAVIGTLFFFFRLVLMIVGGFAEDMHLEGGHGDMDVGHGDVDVGHAAMDAGQHQADHSPTGAFRLISMNTLTGFFMMFGWAGLAGLVQYEMSSTLAVMLGLGAGFIAMWITALLFVLAARFTSPGARFEIGRTVGSTARVYQRIGADSRGKVQLTAHDMTQELEAVSEDKIDIDSFETVEVVRIVDSQTVSVRKV